VRKLDAGNLICQKSVNIGSDETAIDLYDRLFELGANMLDQALLLLADAAFSGQAQDPQDVTHCGKITKEDGEVDWPSPSAMVYNRYRAYTPWPGTFTYLENHRLQIIRMSLPSQERMSTSDLPGAFLYDEASQVFRAKCGAGEIQIEQVKPAGKNILTAKEFYNGLRNKSARFHSLVE
jgi:methionyl-tRNA formyltransferase